MWLGDVRGRAVLKNIRNEQWQWSLDLARRRRREEQERKRIAQEMRLELAQKQMAAKQVVRDAQHEAVKVRREEAVSKREAEKMKKVVVVAKREERAAMQEEEDDARRRESAGYRMSSRKGRLTKQSEYAYSMRTHAHLVDKSAVAEEQGLEGDRDLSPEVQLGELVRQHDGMKQDAAAVGVSDMLEEYLVQWGRQWRAASASKRTLGDVAFLTDPKGGIG